VTFITSDFRTKIFQVTLHSPIDATSPAISFFLFRLAEQCLVKIQTVEFSLYDFLYSDINPTFFGPNIFLSALFANNSANVRARPNPEKITTARCSPCPDSGTLHNWEAGVRKEASLHTYTKQHGK